MMADGYVDIASPPQNHSSATEKYQVGYTCPQTLHKWPVALPNKISQEEILGSVGVTGRDWNAGILKGTNHIKPIMKGPEGDGVVARSRSRVQRGKIRKLSAQEPGLTFSIPYAATQGRDLRRSSSIDDGLDTATDPQRPTFCSETGSPETPCGNESHEITEITTESSQVAPQSIDFMPYHHFSESPSLSHRSNISASSFSISIKSKVSLKEYGHSEMTRSPEMSIDHSMGKNEGSMEIKWPRQSHPVYHFHQMAHEETRSRSSSLDLCPKETTDIEKSDLKAYRGLPTHYHGGNIFPLLKVHDPKRAGHITGGRPFCLRLGDIRGTVTRGRSLSTSSCEKPARIRKWYDKSPNPSATSLASSIANNSFSSYSSQTPVLKRSRSSGAFMGATNQLSKSDLKGEVQITVHTDGTLARQRYILKLCLALMKYGAPTHRLEEYMQMTSRALQIDGQFLYIPGCMIASFEDTLTNTTEIKLVKSSQGIDLGRLADVHQIYKEVLHDVIGVEKATDELEVIMKRKPKFNTWFLIFMHGCASATVGPFAFSARPVDMPVAFVLGCLLGILQLILSPRSQLYANVFEISATIFTSFLSRAFGSIHYGDGRLFCFPALAQSAIALILPGYMVLCGSLELQSRNIIAGSVRMVYSIIYSLFLGFGITIGTAVYGLLDSNATSDYMCPPSPLGNEYLQRLPFVPLFTFSLAIINLAKWQQVPMMVTISLSGYVVNYLSMQRFGTNTQVANALGAFAIGVMGNLYSRLGHGLAAAAILPAILVQVPSGLAASGSLVSGITSADEMTRNQTQTLYSIITNGTQGFLAAENYMMQPNYSNSKQYGDVIFGLGYGMIQVAIGITVGLFFAALVVYPFGKKRGGLFSF